MDTALDRPVTPVPHDHVVQFYEDESFLADCVATFLAPGLRQGQPAVVVATEPHRRACLRTLTRKHGIDVATAKLSGQLTCLDARETLKLFMVDGMPDAGLLKERLGAVLSQIVAAHPGQRLLAYGEMVDLLWRDNNAHAAIRLEEIWNELAGSYSFSLLCAYDVTTFTRSSSGVGIREICQTHGHVIPAESYRETWTESERQRAVMDLQVRAAALVTEIEQRKAMERSLRLALAARRAAEDEKTGLQTDAAVAREALERTQQAQQATKAWLVGAATGMRTPLNAILGWTHMVSLTQPDPATLKQAIAAIEGHAQALNRLVDGLLEPRRDGAPDA